ncbi:MAG: hypothetical protein HMLKMBBP_01146 [Planctomycetes bacterium]|nr:hypothetical protein [Planctomycetota bacterium]
MLPWLLLPLAFAGGWMLGGEPDREARRGPPGTTGDSEAEGRRAATVVPSGGSAKPAVPLRAGAAQRDLESVLRAAMSEGPRGLLDALPRSTKTITGRAVDSEGNPVPGVLVRGDPDLPREITQHLWSSDEEDAEPLTTPEDRALRDALRTLRNGPLQYAAWRETRTAADGTYVLGDLFDLEYDVEGYLAGAEVDEESGDVRPGGTADFVVKRTADVILTVLGPTGAEVPHAAVFATDDMGDHPFEYDWLSKYLDWTPTSRTMRVPAGPNRFAARDGVLQSAVVEATVPAAGPIVLRMAPTAEVTVRLPDKPAGLCAEVSLCVKLTTAEGVPVAEDWSEDDGRDVRFPAIPSGRYRIALSLGDDDPPLASIDADVAPGPNEFTLSALGVSSEAGFFVEGLRADGTPVDRGSTGVEVSFPDVEDTPAWSLLEGADPGRWFLARNPGRADLRVRIRMTEEGATAETETTWGTAGPVVLRLPRTWTTVVRGMPARGGWSIELITPDGRADANCQAERDDDGAWTFSQLNPGDYEIRAWDRRHGGSFRFRVPGAPILDWRPVPFRALRVEGIDLLEIAEADADAAANGAGATGLAALADGDLIVGIDGAEFADRIALEAARASAQSRPSARVTVLRGSKRLELVVDPVALFADDALSLELATRD